MRTNRDLYLSIAELVQSSRDNPRSLETYLRCLSAQAAPFAAAPGMPLATFFSLLRASLAAETEPKAAMPANVGEPNPGGTSYEDWQALIARQIADLSEMREAGTLDQAFFGIAAPSGSIWYNTSVSGFLECAAAGTFGGWQPGDDTGRKLVPGDVAYLKEDGSIGSAPASAFEHPIRNIDVVTWEEAIDFLWCGQTYE